MFTSDSQMAFDLFGMPFHMPAARAETKHRKRDLIKTLLGKRERFLRRYTESPNLKLFDDLWEFLKSPIIQNIPEEYRSDIGTVGLEEGDEEVREDEDAASVQIPYQPWGNAWVDVDGMKWSAEAILFTQIRLFWRSFEELALNNNQEEKWSVLKWIFRPAIRKYWWWNKRKNRSEQFAVHEREEPFTFHNSVYETRL